ncbi:MAG: GPMC system MBL fold metallohydrolase [Desulfuromonadales bacterium]|nr:GPMC system MBL fold metallohydrolase [Desulfuromonadales bacterium]
MQAETLDIIVLGSGTSTGIPVVGCHCAICRSNHPHNQRSRCSALLSYGKYNILIDTSTDLRQQALREDICHVEAVFYTHCHADHLHGIDDLRGFNLRSKHPIPLYGSKATLTKIRNNFSYIFDQSQPSSYIPRLELHPIDQPLDLFGLQIIPIPLRHGSMETYGYRCGAFAYLTDCNAIPPSSLALLDNLEVLILDGLRFTPHNTHFNIPQAVEIAQKIGAKQTLLTHLSHEVDHPIHDRQLPQGINLAFDGQRFSCSANTNHKLQALS